MASRLRRCFGIGLPKTGTTSLAFAMKELGYRAVHVCFSRTLMRRASFVCDTPIWAEFSELDREFPGSLFIHSVRNLESWLKSTETHLTPFMGSEPYYRVPENPRSYYRVFRTHRFHKEKFREGFLRHADRVGRYFRRRHDLLRIDITAGDGWESLCGFLERPVPRSGFPAVMPDHARFDNLLL